MRKRRTNIPPPVTVEEVNHWNQAVFYGAYPCKSVTFERVKEKDGHWHERPRITRTCLKHGDFVQVRVGDYKDRGCPTCSPSISKMERAWLATFNNPKIIYQHKITLPGGKKYVVDGYDPETNTAYEFFGIYWHGKLEYYDPLAHNKTTGELFGDAYRRTIKKIDDIRMAKYNLVYIWEDEWILQSTGKLPKPLIKLKNKRAMQHL